MKIKISCQTCHQVAHSGWITDDGEEVWMCQDHFVYETRPELTDKPPILYRPKYFGLPSAIGIKGIKDGIDEELKAKMIEELKKLSNPETDVK